MGVVYEAEQVSLGRRVALKVLPFSAAIDPRQRQRFQVEAQAAAHLHHQHIVPVFAVGCDRGVHYYAMQFIEGQSLANVIRDLRRLDQLGPLPSAEAIVAKPAHEAASDVTGALAGVPSDPPSPGSTISAALGGSTGDVPSDPSPSHETFSMMGTSYRSRAFARMVARLGAQAADALEHAHGLGVVHRDIKPSNLMLDLRSELWVTDFGLARLQDEPGVTRTGDLVGTLRYMSPEQALAKQVVIDHRTDIYSLGATLYELLTLRPVFDGKDRQELLRQIATEEPVAARRVNPNIPRDLETILQKAMDKDPARRYASAQELADDLRRFLEDKAIRARRPTPLEHVVKWSKRHQPIVATAVAVLVIAGLIGGTLLFLEQQKTKKALDDTTKAYEQVVNMWKMTYPLMDGMTMGAMAQASQSSVEATRTSPEARAIYDGALKSYESIAKWSEGTDPLRPVTAGALHRVGFVRMVQRLPQAEDAFLRSIALYEELIKEEPKGNEHRVNLIGTLSDYALFKSYPNNRRAAEPIFRRRLEVVSGLVADFPNVPGYQLEATEFREFLAMDLEAAGRKREADEIRTDIRRQYEALANKPETYRVPLAQGLDMTAVQFMGNGRRDSAERFFRFAMLINPKLPSPKNNLAWLFATRPLNRPEEAVEAVQLAKNAVESQPESWAYLNTLALAYYRDGKLDEATETVKRGLTFRQAADANDWLILALVAAKKGDKDEARRLHDQSVAWMRARQDHAGELKALATEVASLLGGTTSATTGNGESKPAAVPTEQEN